MRLWQREAAPRELTPMDFFYCPQCGTTLREQKRGKRERRACSSCDFVHYKNPTVGVAIILVEQGKLLLIKRRSSSKGGMWCIPCGHVEWDEEIRSCARREMREETGFDVVLGPVFDAHSNFHDRGRQTVGVWFLSKVCGGALDPGSDAEEARFFPLDDLPSPMAFPTDLFVCEKLRGLLASGEGALEALWRGHSEEIVRC